MKQKLFKDFAPDFYLDRKKRQRIPFERTEHSLEDEPENLDGPQRKNPLQFFIDPETREQFYLVSGVREKLGKSERTVKRMVHRGELKCIWKRIGTKGRPVQLFPKKEIDSLQAPVRQKKIAEYLGTSDRQWRRIKKKGGLDRASAEAFRLSRFEHQKQLLDLARRWKDEKKKQRNGS